MKNRLCVIIMNQLKAKKIKRHILKSYEFWQIDEKFLVVSPDKNSFFKKAWTPCPRVNPAIWPMPTLTIS